MRPSSLAKPDYNEYQIAKEALIAMQITQAFVAWAFVALAFVAWAFVAQAFTTSLAFVKASKTFTFEVQIVIKVEIRVLFLVM